MKQWAEDASPLFTGEIPFEGAEIYQDDMYMYDELLKETGDADGDTKVWSSVTCLVYVVVNKTQARSSKNNVRSDVQSVIRAGEAWGRQGHWCLDASMDNFMKLVILERIDFVSGHLYVFSSIVFCRRWTSSLPLCVKAAGDNVVFCHHCLLSVCRSLLIFSLPTHIILIVLVIYHLHRPCSPPFFKQFWGWHDLGVVVCP